MIAASASGALVTIVENIVELTDSDEVSQSRESFYKKSQ